MSQSQNTYKLNSDKLLPNLSFSPSSPKEFDFFALQPKAKGALNQFLKNNNRTLLVLKAENSGDIFNYLEQYIQEYDLPQSTNPMTYDIYQGEDVYFPKVSLVPQNEKNLPFFEAKKVISALYYDQNQLFGSVTHAYQKTHIQLNAGLIHQAHQGILLLSVASLLQDPSLWPKLKQTLLTQQAYWYSLDPYKSLPCNIPPYPLATKVILLGSRQELAIFTEEEERLYDFADYAEIEPELLLNNPNAIQNWAMFITFLAEQQELKISQDGLLCLYQYLTRDTEDHFRVSISPIKIKNILTQSAILTSTQYLTSEVLQTYFKHLYQQQNSLQEQSIDAILQDQIYVATEGSVVGQINGLSVIEYAGVPQSFGEPVRISCLVQFGEGEIIDVERKNELAGNLHSKGLMIAQACLSNILNLPTQLPFSATVVFEQSYGEIDGDSASLACLIALISALADEPIPQHIAITGAIDQFGVVHTVGGVNDKIEGFFTLCQQRGLNGQQGVIIPKNTLTQLSLSPEVVSAVSQQQFNIWVVEDINQACELMFKQPLFTNNEEDVALSLAEGINQRLERYGDNPTKSSFWAKLFQRD